MKPKILQVLDDQNIGGIIQTMRSLSNSRLGEEFEFKLTTSKNVLSVLQVDNPEIVIFRNPCSWQRSLNLSLIKLYTKKVIIHEHHYSPGFEQRNVADLGRFHAMLRFCYGLADRVVAISKAQQVWMQENHLVAPQKLALINQCRHLDHLLKVPKKRIQKPLILAAYGRFSKQKGLDILLQATQLIPDVNIQLNLGGYGEDEHLLKRLAQGQKNIKFWGEILDISAFLSTCDVVVIPSRWEPWGNVCVEAKAAGKPVIASDIDGLSEQVQDCGFLFPPDNPEALAESIQAIVSVPDQHLEIWGNNGRESVATAWERYVTCWEIFLKEALIS
ncbi:MAG: glycosyltransferase family 4 protein [Leptolyngbyaceae cyanobacterium CSU_1_3]|nr:glycosyltransferase family 4 protein [Leptolyngbyaceae cyanobacterium CSU_1_3]